MVFTNTSILLAYLPSTGPPGPLNANLLDPLSTSSGVFGGEVLALRFNIDFSEAGHTLGSSGIPFGDLVIHDLAELPQWNGFTVRQVLGDLNTLLGGGSTGYSLAVANQQAFQLNYSFSNGVVDQWAQDHLMVVPEPPSVVLVGSGLLGVLGWSWSRRRRARA